MTEWHAKDCIVRYERLLLEKGVINPDQIENIRDTIEKTIETAVNRRPRSPAPGCQ